MVMLQEPLDHLVFPLFQEQKMSRLTNKHYQKHIKQQGATSIEYALMASLIAVVIIVTVSAFGLATSGLFQLFLNSVS